MNIKVLRYLPLYQRMLFGLLAVAALAGVVGYYLTNSFIQQTLQDYAGKISIDVTRLTLETFDQKLDEKIFFWDAYFHSRLFLNAVKADNTQFDMIPDKQKVIEDRDRLWIAGKVNEKNSDWYRQIAEDPQSVTLKDFAGQNNYYDQEHLGISEIFFSNTYGTTVFMNQRTSDYYQGDEAWWQMAMKEGVYIGDVEFDESAGTYGITIGLRIDDGGKTLGVAKILYKLTEAQELIKTIVLNRISESKEFGGLLGGKLVDKDLNVIYSIGPVSVNAPYKKVLHSLTVKTDTYECCIEAPVNGDEKRLLLAHSRSLGHGKYPGINWGFILEYDTDALFAPLRRMALVIAAFVLVIFIILFFYCYFFFKPIVRTIEKLEAVMGKVIEGDLTIRTNISRPDELGALANHFDQMVERLQSAIHTKENFLSVATHSLKAPLTGIKWNVELILSDKKQKLTVATKKTLNTIHEVCSQLVTVISDVLRVNKLSSMKAEKGASFDPIPFILSMKDSLDTFAKSYQVTLHLPTGQLKRHIFIDQEIFKNIVENLVSNAVKYGKRSGEVTLRISAKNNLMVLSVTDNGIGIPPEEQKSICTQFYRATNAATHQVEGSGLGLFIIQREVHNWGGTLEFISKVDKGSTFTITLPLKNSTRPPHSLLTSEVGNRL